MSKRPLLSMFFFFFLFCRSAPPFCSSLIWFGFLFVFLPLQTILIQNIYRNPQNSAQTADASRCKSLYSTAGWGRGGGGWLVRPPLFVMTPTSPSVGPAQSLLPRGSLSTVKQGCQPYRTSAVHGRHSEHPRNGSNASQSPLPQIKTMLWVAGSLCVVQPMLSPCVAELMHCLLHR